MALTLLCQSSTGTTIVPVTLSFSYLSGQLHCAMKNEAVGGPVRWAIQILGTVKVADAVSGSNHVIKIKVGPHLHSGRQPKCTPFQFLAVLSASTCTGNLIVVCSVMFSFEIPFRYMHLYTRSCLIRCMHTYVCKYEWSLSSGSALTNFAAHHDVVIEASAGGDVGGPHLLRWSARRFCLIWPRSEKSCQGPPQLHLLPKL